MLQRAVFGLGSMELVLLFGVVLLLWGPSKLPELARGVGKGLREFRKASAEVNNAIHDASVEELDAPHGSVSPTAATKEAEVAEKTGSSEQA